MDSFKIGPTKAYSLFRSSPTNSSVEKPLFDDEFPKVLLAMQEEAYNLIVAKEFQTAIPKLKKLEQVLEVVVIQGGPSDSDLILATIHNIALCYQRLGDLEKCNAYLEGCIFNVSKVGVMRVNSSMTETELRKDVYKIKLFVQSCAVFSQLERHKKAFENAKNALKLSIATIKLTIKACKSEIDKYKSLKKKNAHISNDLRKSFKLIYMSYPAIKALRKYIVTGSLDHVPKMRSVLGIKDDPD